ncbi:MAG: universal stress protein [Candidatus Melainabacteria bacterium]|nr:universal stress protein [Candidatus Melainabacteria bacterium]
MDILIPLDGKPHSQLSVNLALRLLDLSNKRVILLHVTEKPDPAELLKDPTGQLEKVYSLASYEASEHLLSVIAQPLSQAGAKPVIKVEEGIPAQTIASVALSEQVGCIIAAPGHHKPQDLLLNGSITLKLLQCNFPGIFILARPLSFKKDKGKVVFVVDGTAEVEQAIKSLLPHLPATMPLVLVASDEGYKMPLLANKFLHDSRIEGGWPRQEHKNARLALESASQQLEEAQRPYEKLLVKTTFDSWIGSYIQKHPVELLAFARSRHDVLHRSIGGSHIEKLFLKTTCSTALHCTKILPYET